MALILNLSAQMPSASSSTRILSAAWRPGPAHHLPVASVTLRLHVEEVSRVHQPPSAALHFSFVGLLHWFGSIAQNYLNVVHEAHEKSSEARQVRE